MKKPNIILLLLMVLACLAACHKDKEMDVKEAVVSNEEMTVSETQARFSWQVEFAGQFQTGVEVSQSENMADLRRVEASKEEDKFVAVVDSLTEGKKYYYRIVVWNKFGSYEEIVKDFTTAKTFSIHVEASEGGTATGGGRFAEGDTCTVVATANVGYNFVNWTENGNQVSAEAEYSFAVTGNRSLVANFTSQEYTITATAEPIEGGVVEGSGGYNNGDECTMTATANEGYEFLNWTKEDGTIVSLEPVYAFTVTETAAFVAHFQIKSYTITIEANPNNGGTVDGGGTYEYGQSCTVHATEANGYHFVNWTENGGQVSSGMEYTFIVTGDRDLVANFSAEDYIISVEIEPEDGGTVTGAGGYNYDDECTLKATANEGYDFVNWTKEDGTVVSADATYSFTVTESASFVAHFQIRSYTVTVSANPNNGGSVYVGYSPGATQGTFNSGQYCTVHAIANSGYRFVNWTENDSVVANYATYDFHVTSDRELVAHFTRVYTINVSANPTNGGTVTGSGFYEEGETCRVTATANPNFTFVNWMDGSQVASIDAEYTFTVTGNRTLVAHFEPQAGNYTISVSANPSNGGSVSGGGQYQQGQICTVHATANSGYTFTNWTENGTVVSTQANYTFTVNSNRTLVANFTRQYTITVSASTGGSAHVGSATGPTTGTYNQGQSCTVYAVANSNYTFANWTENGSVVSTQANYTFTVNSNRTLVANFQQQTTDQTFNVNGVSFTMKRVEGGTFWMGAQSTDPSGQNYDSEAYDKESPVHSVTLSTFYMGETEVTQELWQAVMGSNPSWFSGTNLPVEQVTWTMIVNQFLPALNAATGRNFRLPTEAEWEYASRGGNQGHGYKYAGSNTIGNVAWYSDNSNSQTHAVATKQPNELGLYDMSGNVWEWCSDWYGNYSSGSQTNPQGPSSGSNRVLRGGSWSDHARYCRVSFRSGINPDYASSINGFRLALFE